MKIHRILPLFLVLSACADKPHPENEPVVITDDQPAVGAAVQPVEFPQIDDNIAHDTLLIQTTFDLQDDTYIMVASHVDEEASLDVKERQDGLRLYHYRITEDASPEILAVSSPAYDSWTMFPTFFEDPLQADAYIILANFGERNSWGQKVLRFDAGGFRDLGFINVAALERMGEGAEVEVKLRPIAPHTTLHAEGEGIRFNFNISEVILYDDLRGGLDQAFQGTGVSYRWSPLEGMVLLIDGEPRHEQQPS